MQFKQQSTDLIFIITIRENNWNIRCDCGRYLGTDEK